MAKRGVWRRRQRNWRHSSAASPPKAWVPVVTTPPRARWPDLPIPVHYRRTSTLLCPTRCTTPVSSYPLPTTPRRISQRKAFALVVAVALFNSPQAPVEQFSDGPRRTSRGLLAQPWVGLPRRVVGWRISCCLASPRELVGPRVSACVMRASYR